MRADTKKARHMAWLSYIYFLNERASSAPKIYDAYMIPAIEARA